MLKMIGEIRGIKFRTVPNPTGPDYEFRSLVIEDEKMESTDISLGRDQETDQFLGSLEKLKGKVCELSVYLRTYKTKNGSNNFSLNYSGTELPKPI